MGIAPKKMGQTTDAIDAFPWCRYFSNLCTLFILFELEAWEKRGLTRILRGPYCKINSSLDLTGNSYSVFCVTRKFNVVKRCSYCKSEKTIKGEVEEYVEYISFSQFLISIITYVPTWSIKNIFKSKILAYFDSI